ncbi:CoA transferase [Fulvimarina endophytica]|uniref:CoA transferase n=1 Tax=Fulvimarina endophytica TaxID=2293836 RepID=A0A371X036_9HYPH|nr:CoA transferase [Fulvimarina endophytica]RFC62601.1 CoA transferase [Fulvimarina endophytica]
MAGPLSGIRIADFTSMIAGPLATMILADQGADVIKIERPEGGDHSRQVADRRGGFSASFLQNNRNKRSVALDLKSEAGLQAALDIAASADVVVENFRPGVAERIGIGYEAIRALRPDIVYVSIAGFGFTGEWAKRPVYDPLIQALSGLASVQGGDGPRPRLVRTIVPDKVTAIQASQAITAALFARERTGEGNHLTLSMLDTVAAFLFSSDMSAHTFIGEDGTPDRDAGGMPAERTEAPGQAPAPPDDDKAQSFIELIYETADGFMAVSAHTDKTWAGLSAAVGKPEWLYDARFSTVELRETNKAERLELTQSALLEDTTANWMARLSEHDVPCAPVLTRGEMIDHPQVVANGTVLTMDHPQAGPIRLAASPARFARTPLDPPRPARRLGADTRAVLAEAGYDEDRIEALLAAGAGAQPDEDAR